MLWRCLCLLAAACITAGGSAQIANKLSAYDVVWDSPSVDASGSMPIGNGEVVVNAWAEQGTGDILLLLARTDARSEISRILKLGRVRIKLDPSPFVGPVFHQRLHLHDGTIAFEGSGETLRLFVDSNAHVVHLVGTLRAKRKVTVSLESWRLQPRPLPKNEGGSAWSVHDAPFPLVESADRVLNLTPTNRLGWYHHNATTIVPQVLAEQSLTGAAGSFDPLLGRTFGATVAGLGLKATDTLTLKSPSPTAALDISIATATTMGESAWIASTQRASQDSPTRSALARTAEWWHRYWERAYVFAREATAPHAIPDNIFPLRKGVDANGGNIFPGQIADWFAMDSPVLVDGTLHQGWLGEEGKPFHPTRGLVLQATVTLTQDKPGRIFDKLTAGSEDGFLFDTHPGHSLRLIVGNFELSAPNCLKVGTRAKVGATYDASTGEAAIYLDGKRIAHHAADDGSAITRAYLLQRYVQACQGRGQYPIKFNGGFYSVEPKAMGRESNPDFRNWGDSEWWQNVRHIYHPMLASGDFEMMTPLFRLYESAVPLARQRTALYHGAQGVYFPETMTDFGTYSGGDYGWDRKGHAPKDVQCPWWQYAWNQGPELVALMLDKWDYTRDESFLKAEALPMAVEVLKYFDTRFKKDTAGQIVLDPAQSVETYWEGVVNDMPTTSGLRAVTSRLCLLPARLVTRDQRAFFQKMKKACPALPVARVGSERRLSPAQKFVDKTSNVENPELYAVWPFRVVDLAHPDLMVEARAAYRARKNHLDTGWGYDGNVAALLGMADEAGRIMRVKAANSNSAYRWPATWGPNFDWLPDQNHGGNLLMTTELMLLQCEPMEAGGAIRLLPAWPRDWDVSFRLHAPANTTVECEYQAGKVKSLTVTPASRRKDVVFP